MSTTMLRFVSVVAVLLLSGCADTSPKTDCTSDSCPSGTRVSPPVGPIVIPSLEYPLAATRIVEFEDCDSGIGLANVPIEPAQAVVPDDFEITYTLSVVPRTASIHITGVACSRVVVNTTILQNVSWFRIGVFVEPKNESWRGNGINRYLTDIWFSSAELAEWFKPVGAPVEAAQFGREGVPPGSATRTDRWTIDGSRCDIRTDFHISGRSSTATDETFYFWVGSKPYQRLEVFEAWADDAEPTSAAPFEIEGDCPSHQIFTNVPVHATRYKTEYNATLSITGQMFG